MPPKRTMSNNHQEDDGDDDTNPPGFYRVEKILNHRINKRTGKTEYFLKWEGYPASENSWEPEDNVTDDLISDFNRRRRNGTVNRNDGHPKSSHPKTPGTKESVGGSLTSNPSAAVSASVISVSRPSASASAVTPGSRRISIVSDDSSTQSSVASSSASKNHEHNTRRGPRKIFTPSGLMRSHPYRPSPSVSASSTHESPVAKSTIVQKVQHKTSNNTTIARSPMVPDNNNSVHENHVNSSNNNMITPDDESVKQAAEVYRGLEPKEIMGAVRLQGKPYFKMVWSNDPQDDLIPAKYCNILFPQQVISYYEKNIHFL